MKRGFLLASLLCAALVTGCGASTREEGRPRADHPPTGGSSASPTSLRADADADAGTDAGAEDTRIAGMAAELLRLRDASNTFGAQTQTPRKDWRPLPAARRGPFPRAAVAEIRAYAFGFDSRTELDTKCDVLAPDGTFCPSVVAPGTQLSPEQREQLMRLVIGAKSEEVTSEGRHAKRAVTRCGFEAHHAFLFFDAAGRPVAELLVCFTCSEWALTPATESVNATPAMMWDDERIALRSLCEELKLGGCFLGDDEVMGKVNEHLRSKKRREGDGR